MSKKTIRLTESQLINKIKKAICENIDIEPHSLTNSKYNATMSLNEMAQINLHETGREKSGNFDESRYYVYVKGEGGFKKFPHFHIKHKTEGWDIRMNVDGSFNSIKQKSANRQTDKDFADIEKVSLQWAKMPNAFEPDKTNGKVAEIEWYRNNN